MCSSSEKLSFKLELPAGAFSILSSYANTLNALLQRQDYSIPAKDSKMFRAIRSGIFLVCLRSFEMKSGKELEGFVDYYYLVYRELEELMET